MAEDQLARSGINHLVVLALEVFTSSIGSIRGIHTFQNLSIPLSMPSLRAVAGYVLGVAQLAMLSHSGGVRGGSPLTCTNPQLSCHDTTPQTDTCCFNSPGGLLLATQFWDANPSTGPSNSWTIHGLW